MYVLLEYISKFVITITTPMYIFGIWGLGSSSIPVVVNLARATYVRMYKPNYLYTIIL